MRFLTPALCLNLALALPSSASADEVSAPVEWEREPIRSFEAYKPSYFLLGKPITKMQISLKVQALRGIPLYAGYSQLMMWDLFKTSAPFRDLNYNPDIFYRFEFGKAPARHVDLGVFEHESNGMGGPDSRSWNRAYVRYSQNRQSEKGGVWWSAKAWISYGISDPQSESIKYTRGVYEIQIGLSDYFDRLFEVNELVLRLYGGGRSRVNPLEGGQELTYREKITARKVLLPMYLQIFHGYGENLLDAEDRRWGFRAGFGF